MKCCILINRFRSYSNQVLGGNMKAIFFLDAYAVPAGTEEDDKDVLATAAYTLSYKGEAPEGYPAIGTAFSFYDSEDEIILEDGLKVNFIRPGIRKNGYSMEIGLETLYLEPQEIFILDIMRSSGWVVQGPQNIDRPAKNTS